MYAAVRLVAILAKPDVRPPCVTHGVVDLPVQELALLGDVGHRLRGDAHIPLAILDREMRKRAERQAAGARAARLAAEPISHQQGIRRLFEAGGRSPGARLVMMVSCIRPNRSAK
jgi:hypothetical protein